MMAALGGSAVCSTGNPARTRHPQLRNKQTLALSCFGVGPESQLTVWKAGQGSCLLQVWVGPNVPQLPHGLLAAPLPRNRQQPHS